MSNYQVEPAHKPQALTTEALKSLRHEQVQGISRRELIRGSLAAGVGLWLLEVTAGTVGFLWPNLQGKFGGQVKIGTFDEVVTGELEPADQRGLPGLLLRGARVRDPHRHVAAAVHPGRGRDRRRHARSTSARSTSAARTSAASRTRASRTSGWSARATGRATTAWGSRRSGRSTGRRRGAWTGSAWSSTATAC